MSFDRYRNTPEYRNFMKRLSLSFFSTLIKFYNFWRQIFTKPPKDFDCSSHKSKTNEVCGYSLGIYQQVVIYHLRIEVGGGRAMDTPPSWSNFFHFHAFLREKWLNNSFSRPPLDLTPHLRNLIIIRRYLVTVTTNFSSFFPLTEFIPVFQECHD